VPLRVLHVSQPIEAGVPNVVTALVTDQVAAGYDVHVACPPEPGLADRAVWLGATHHTWSATRSPGPAVVGETRRLGRIIDDVDPDVVVLHSAKAGLAGRLAVRGRRPTVFVPHAWSFDAVHGPVATASAAWERFAARWTGVAVCVSEDERTRGHAVGVRVRMEVVPNGVDVELLRPTPAVKARARMGLDERPTVVCVGRLAEQKGQDLLLKAWRTVASAVPGAQLVLVGDGPERAALQAAAPADVVFTGNRSDVSEFLAAADVVAFPSRWEGGPLVPLEAMAMGRPVVAFDVCGVRASLGSTGAVLEPGNVPGFAAALVRLLKNPAQARAAGAAARQRVLEVADLRQTLTAWNSVLASLVTTTAPSHVPVDVADLAVGPPIEFPVPRLTVDGTLPAALDGAA
jgi:glycosyltransferase involved in cell wall biosynthesis